MNFGKFDRQLRLQKPAVVAQNAFGEPAPASFTDVVTVWGEQKPVSGSEPFLAQQQTAEQVVKWQIRYRADLDATWQFTCEGKLYQLTAPPVEIGRRQGLLLTTTCRGAAPLPVAPPRIHSAVFAAAYN